MVIPLQINDSQPVSLLFDTGTGITLLSQDYVKTLHLQQDEKTRMATIEKMLLNPLNTGFQSNVKLNNVPAQLENFAMLRKYLYVQGIFGLSEMVKTHAVIFVKEGLVFLRSG
ncbi:aspartyl protease family protein [Candidiatus Paracoxiella cheracis]|uniref:aspartyl protease family protein n=1 Tax=Candidiatus Paracoxiella cheracis TaxID=3405120 RepID=UPI003BF4AE59